MQTTSNSKRIAKNTMMLYFRQILIMLVSLYTVRVTLNILGAEDYGIFNVVAGVVVLFSFVNNAMASSTQRFLNFYLGRNETDKVNEIFSSSCIIHLAICIIFLLLAETIGLWFVKFKLNIPYNRHEIVIIVYQMAIISTIFNILRVPYNAVMIAYEKMDFFAYISILEVFMKLGIVFILRIISIDKLVTYSFLIMFVSFFILVIFKIYCNTRFDIAHFRKVKDVGLVKEIIRFSGWSILGAAANVINTQGINIVLNIFTNVTVNAAMGIANQVNTAVYSFVSNYQLAFNPQIVKSYSSNDNHSFYSLIYTTAKFSFFLLLLIVVPLYLNVEEILIFWLKNVPDYTIPFVKLILLWSLIESLSGPLWMSVQAIGKIRNYQIIVSILILLNIPISIIMLLFFKNPCLILIIRIILNFITLIWRCFYLERLINISALRFIISVIVRCGIVMACSFLCTFIVKYNLSGFNSFLISCFMSVVFNFIFIWFIGLDREQRLFILKKIKGVKND